MFGMSGEHLLILGIVLLIFGPRRLPELGNTMGKAIRNFKDALSGVEEAKYRKINDEKGGVQELNQEPAQTLNQTFNQTLKKSLETAEIGPKIEKASDTHVVVNEVHHSSPSSPA